MTFLCIKYSGLKFYYVFETNDFIFIPMKEVEDQEKNRLLVEEIFSCNYDQNSHFYVLLKEPVEWDLTIEDFSEENLYKFKLLESILNLLFSNSLKRDCIFLLKKEDSVYNVKKIFQNLSKGVVEKNPPLLWNHKIIINYLREIIDVAFDKFSSIVKKEDFALRYAFCVDMYLRGKFGDNRLRYISDLWISLEILSVITIMHILHSHELFEVENFFEELKKIVEDYSSKILKDKVDCWKEMRDKFPEHMKNKINKFLPIFQKCVKVAKEYLNINDIKVIFKKETEFKGSTEYQKYLDTIRVFKEYQDKITIKNVIDKFYEYRNKLFHGGKISDKWTLKSDRIKANFIKILEQLFFKVLGLNMIFFYQVGYPHQKIFEIPSNEGELLNLGSLSRSVSLYIYKQNIEPLIEDYKSPFNDLKIAIKNYIEKQSEYDSLRSRLNSSVDQLLVFLNNHHPVQLIVDGKNYDHSIDYRDIKEKTIILKFGSGSSIYEVIFDKKQVVIKNKDNTNITTIFCGMFDDDKIRHGISMIVPFLINPPYLSIEFN